MRKLWVLSIALCLALACGKDESPELPVDFIVTEVSGLTDGQKVWGIIELDFQVSGGGENIQVLLEIDENEEASLSFPFSYNLNTETLTEGLHTLTVQASDAEGNLSNELRFELTVANEFLTVTVKNDAIKSHVTKFLLLTSESNEVLGFTRLENGETYDFERPSGFSDDFYNYHILDKVDGIAVEITSYMKVDITQLDIEPLSSEGFDRGDREGNVDMVFTNVPAHDYFMFHPFPDLFSTGNSLSWPTDIEYDKYANADIVYMFLRSGDQGYYKKTNITGIGQQIMDLSDMLAMESVTVNTDGQITSASASAVDESFYQGRTMLFSLYQDNGGVTDLNQIQVHVPEDKAGLSSFFTSVTYTRNDLSYTSSIEGETDWLVPTSYDASFSVSSFSRDEMDIQVQGSFDEMEIRIGSNPGQPLVYRRLIYTNDATWNYDQFPEIPSDILGVIPELNADNFQQISFYNVKLTEYQVNGRGRKTIFGRF